MAERVNKPESMVTIGTVMALMLIGIIGYGLYTNPMADILYSPVKITSGIAMVDVHFNETYKLNVGGTEENFSVKCIVGAFVYQNEGVIALQLWLMTENASIRESILNNITVIGDMDSVAFGHLKENNTMMTPMCNSSWLTTLLVVEDGYGNVHMGLLTSSATPTLGENLTDTLFNDDNVALFTKIPDVLDVEFSSVEVIDSGLSVCSMQINHVSDLWFMHLLF